MKPTHQKRAYKAEAIQWGGNNFDEIAALFPTAEAQGKEYVMIRHQYGISTLQRGSWIVKGANGEVRRYDDKQFHLRYEVIA